MPAFTAALAALRRHFGYQAFRPLQGRVVRSVLAGHDTLAILPTGGGKSICFQIPAAVLGGVTVVISPLISLMQDQVAAANARGISAVALNSTLDLDARTTALAAAARGDLRLLYVSPEGLERLARELAQQGVHPALLAIDEAHCIAEWGHDFRPHYRRLRAFRHALGAPPCIALTGSATPPVRDDIARSLGLRHPDLHLGSFDRRNLWLGTVRVRTDTDRIAAITRLLAGDDRMALVYAPTRRLCETIASALSHRGFRAAAYHAGLPADHRRDILNRFLADDVEVVTATSAFGMGIDKPDVRLVLHWAMPPTLESYYQEAGRAGRDGRFGRCILLVGKDDIGRHRQKLADLHGEHRRRAAERLRAIERYATTSGCRRRALLAYFGERLTTCGGCDHCASRDLQLRSRLPRLVRKRLRSLEEALRTERAPWGGGILEPATFVRLATQPPTSAAGLADVPGVGPEIARRFGGRILAALSVTPPSITSPSNDHPLVRWRHRSAQALGVPPYAVLTDAALLALTRTPPTDVTDLAQRRLVGPRTLAKFGEAIVAAAQLASRISAPPSSFGDAPEPGRAPTQS